MLSLFLCIIATFAGILVNAKFRVFSFKTCIAFSLLLVLSVFLGGALHFYETVPYWDKALHFLSGFIFARAGKEIYFRLGGNRGHKWLLVCFSLLFAISAAAFWEMWEFAGDSLFGLTSQNNSLQDTMLDIILGSLSGVIYSLFLIKL